MAILKHREELVPVTCAILKPEDRDAFFAALRKSNGGSPDKIARLLELPVGLVNDWISGKVNMPYHLLQRLGHEFETELPTISELRRESQPALPTAQKRSPALAEALAAKPKEPAPARRKREPQPRPQAPKRQPRRPRGGREARQPQAQAPRRPARTPQAPSPAADGPRHSEPLAWWIGTVLAAGRYEGESVLFAADRRMGQNLAALWAKRTRSIFGRPAALSMKDDGKAQEAAFEAPGLDALLSRVGLKAGEPPQESAVPRWIWSNPSWKTACLRGLVDALGRFQRGPALLLEPPPRLAQAVQKMFAALHLELKAGSGPTLSLEGREAVEKYLDAVGVENLKLRDQFTSFLRRPGSGGSQPDPGDEDSPARQDAPPESRDPAADEKAEAPAPAQQAPKPRPPSRRRTLYRGRPKPG